MNAINTTIAMFAVLGVLLIAVATDNTEAKATCMVHHSADVCERTLQP